MKVYTEQEVRDIPENSEDLRHYKKISAAGGVVINGNDEILMIFRRGKWDLPKGKAEDNEPIELTAERETKEETGLQELTLQRFLLTTYHTYAEKKELIIKDTHWYLFRTPGVPKLTPQIDEDIFQAKWVQPENLGEYLSNSFLLIVDVLKEAGFEEK